MAIIRPFKAVRPGKGMESKIAALPYDVYSRKEAKVVVDANPESFLAIDRAETQFDDSVDTYAPEVYAKASEMLKERITDGRFIQEEKAVYYIYELTMDGRTQTGIAACASIDDYQNAVIKKHENTRADKEEDRIRHVDTCSAQTGPIFLAYRENAVINEVVERTKKNEALYDFVSDDGIRHRVFIIDNDADIKAIGEAFAGIDSIYIADGHHRCASAVKVGLKRRAENPGYTGDEEFNFFMSVIFPDKELMIMDYNRVVHDLNGLNADQFMDKMAGFFEIGEPADSAYKPVAKGNFGMYLAGKWYSITIKDEYRSNDPVDGLDVAILQKYVLDDILGIKDPKTDNRIEFVGGIRGLDELKTRADGFDNGLAFSMYPTSIAELFAVADAGRLMPPKSTWFEPKLRSGIFIHLI